MPVFKSFAPSKISTPIEFYCLRTENKHSGLVKNLYYNIDYETRYFCN